MKHVKIVSGLFVQSKHDDTHISIKDSMPLCLQGTGGVLGGIMCVAGQLSAKEVCSQ